MSELTESHFQLPSPSHSSAICDLAESKSPDGQVTSAQRNVSSITSVLFHPQGFGNVRTVRLPSLFLLPTPLISWTFADAHEEWKPCGVTLEDYNTNDFAEMSNKENPEKIAGFKLQYHKRQIKKKNHIANSLHRLTHYPVALQAKKDKQTGF